MKFKKITLFTNDIEAQKGFFTVILGFELVEESTNYFSVKIGWSTLKFEKGEVNFLYHYCFLLPSNQLENAIKWMEKRVQIIDIEPNNRIAKFESWNADSFYFYDASGNVAECIVRYGLKNETDDEFDMNHFLCVNEIGMPTDDIRGINQRLEKLIGTSFWKGNQEIFGANGSEEGLILLSNYKKRTTWFPTNVKIVQSPFRATIEHENQEFELSFTEQNLEIRKI